MKRFRIQNSWNYLSVIDSLAITFFYNLLTSRSCLILSSFIINFSNPFFNEVNATMQWPIGTPTFRKTVESVKSLCSLEIGNLEAKCSKMALANPRFPSEFSKSIGLTWNISKWNHLSLVVALKLVIWLPNIQKWHYNHTYL